MGNCGRCHHHIDSPDIGFGVAVGQAAVQRAVERGQDMALETLEQLAIGGRAAASD